MTNEEKYQIGRLRAAGSSYRRIATELDISVNSIKSYCRRHGLGMDIHRQEIQLVQIEPCLGPNEATSCAQCGGLVRQVAGRKRRRFCSDVCRLEWWAAHRGELHRKAMHNFICEFCGMQFSRYGVTERRFCSKSCAAHARWQKEAGHDA